MGYKIVVLPLCLLISILEQTIASNSGDSRDPSDLDTIMEGRSGNGSGGPSTIVYIVIVFVVVFTKCFCICYWRQRRKRMIDGNFAPTPQYQHHNYDNTRPTFQYPNTSPSVPYPNANTNQASNANWQLQRNSTLSQGLPEEAPYPRQVYGSSLQEPFNSANYSSNGDGSWTNPAYEGNDLPPFSTGPSVAGTHAITDINSTQIRAHEEPPPSYFDVTRSAISPEISSSQNIKEDQPIS